MKLRDWHDCRRYRRRGYNCPFLEEREHEDPEEEHEERERRTASERGDAGNIPDIYYISRKIIKENTKDQRQPKEVRHVPDTLPFPKKAPLEVPPIAAITPGALKRQTTPTFWPTPARGLQAQRWLERYKARIRANVRTPVRSASTAPTEARSRGTAHPPVDTRRTRPSSSPETAYATNLGRAEQSFTETLPRYARPHATSTTGMHRPNRQNRRSRWTGRRLTAAAATGAIALGAAALTARSGGGGGHSPAPTFRGGRNDPLIWSAR